MLWTIAVALIIFWLLGLVGGYPMGNYIHIALVIAIIAMLVKMEDDCSDYGRGRRGVRERLKMNVRAKGDQFLLKEKGA
jgi:type III secretory pathway component EscV